jgi:hypothetical protein
VVTGFEKRKARMYLQDLGIKMHLILTELVSFVLKFAKKAGPVQVLAG